MDPCRRECDDSSPNAIQVRHLASLNHRSIGFIGSPQASLERHTTYADRARKGFTEACDAVGVASVLRACEAPMPALTEALNAVLDDDGATGVTALVVHKEGLLPLLHEAATRARAAHSRGHFRDGDRPGGGGPRRSAAVSIPVDEDKRATFSPAPERMLVEPGWYDLLIDRSAEDLPLAVTLEVGGEGSPARGCGTWTRVELFDESANALLVPETLLQGTAVTWHDWGSAPVAAGSTGDVEISLAGSVIVSELLVP